MKTYIYNFLIVFIVFIGFNDVFGQQAQTKVADMTKEQMMELSYDNLLQLSFEDLLLVSNKFGMSADELLEFFLNKDVTSASKRAEKSMESPLSTTVISKDEIVNSGATIIPEILRLVPGMIVREKTNGNYDVHIRGNDNVPAKNMNVYSEEAISLIMIDGRPVFCYAFGGTFWETMPVDINDIERVEVIRGPSSALYGPNAVNGVVNIITKHPENNKLSANATVQAGTQNTKLATADVSGGVGKLSTRFSGNYNYRDRFEEDYYIFDLGKYMTYDQMDTLMNPMTGRTTLAEDNWRTRTKDKLGIEKFAGNAFMFYDLNKDVQFNLSAGAQQSEIVSTFLGNHPVALTGRKSSTQYVDFQTKAYNFTFQTNYLMGDQEVEQGLPAWHVDPSILNAQLEYEYTLGSLVLRPGVSYQKATYSDADYIDESNRDGFLNGPKTVTTTAGSLRADYKPFDKLRLIAALRADKYNYPKDLYFTYQFISSYSLNDKNVFRAVYSRANRGSFILNSQADYLWKVAPGNNIYWGGTKDLKLPVMDMFELGYRMQPTKNIMVDLEAFHTQIKNYDYFIFDSLTVGYDFGTQSKTSVLGDIRYYNFDLTSTQTGITCNVSFMLNKQLSFKVFGTYSESKVKDFYSKTIWDNQATMEANVTGLITNDGTLLTYANMANTANTAAHAGDDLVITPDEQAAIDLYTANPAQYNAAATAYLAQQQRVGTLMANGLKATYTVSNPDLVNGKIISDSLINTTNKATPTFYGGFSINYTPIPKLNINSSMYFYSSYSILNNKVDVTDKLNQSYMYEIDPKAILTLKVSYKIWKENTVFVTAKNLLQMNQREFSYADKVGSVYLIGASIGF
jgi:iron complex outermembrane recepter protein